MFFKASKTIFADANNKVVEEQSTTGGTFKVVEAGSFLSDEDAKRYGITVTNASSYGLSVQETTAPATPTGTPPQVTGQSSPGLNVDTMPQPAPSSTATVSPTTPLAGATSKKPTTATTAGVAPQGTSPAPAPPPKEEPKK